MKLALKIIGVVVAVLLVAIVALVIVARHPLPEFTPGPEGDARAKQVAAWVGADAWQKIGAIKWTTDKNRHFLWDKNRGFVRVRWRKSEALYDLMKHDGRAFEAGQELDGEAKKKGLERAYAIFCNDSFWLNPLVKLFDEGTSRAALTVDGKPALMVAYASGGVTPGDKYLWLLDDDGRPLAWRTFVKILKIPGMEFTWEDWQTLGEGARVATTHRLLGLSVQPASGIAAADRPEQLEPGPDPFATIASRR
jgi:hypothetical protein